MKYLCGMTNLSELSLSRTQVSDAGLKHLGGLTNLRSLYLNNTQVTEKGVKELQKSIPNCDIEF